MSGSEFRYCPRCGASLQEESLFGRARPVCPDCRWIYFADPKVAVAALVIQQGQVLLVQRSNEPQRGLWSLPAGFMDSDEDPAAAAERECLEETGLRVQVTGLLDVIGGLEHPHGAHLLIVYRAQVLGGALQPADDAAGAAFFSLEHLPPLAFRTTAQVIQQHRATLPAENSS